MHNQRITFVDSGINRQRLKNIIQGLFDFKANTDSCGRASKVQANIFDKNGDLDGGVPTVDPVGWNWLNPETRKSNWVRFHILNQHLGGPGNNCANLVPTTKASNNNSKWRNFEEAVKKEAREHTITYEAEVTGYHDFPQEPNNGFPKGITASAVYKEGKEVKKIPAVTLSMDAPMKSDGIGLTQEEQQYLDILAREPLSDRKKRLRSK